MIRLLKFPRVNLLLLLMLPNLGISAVFPKGSHQKNIKVSLRSLTTSFEIRNDQKIPLVITKVSATYPCKADYDKRPINKGKSSHLIIDCSPLAVGHFLKTVNLTTNQGQYQLLAEGESLSLSDLSYEGFTPENVVAKEGLLSILEGEDYKFGIPQKIFKMNFFRFSPEKLFKIGNIPSPPENGYADEFTRDRKGFDKLPLGLSSFKFKDAQVINTNCFSCHSSVVDGRVIAGAPNRFFDAHAQKIQTQVMLTAYNNKFIGGPIKIFDGIILTESEEEALYGFKEYYEQVVDPVLKNTLVKGDNPGPYVIWKTLLKMKDDGSLEMNLFQKTALEQKLLGSVQLPQIQPQPWWNLRYKKKAFWNADATHHSPSTFSLNHLDQHPDNSGSMKERMDMTNKHLFYAKQVKAPKYMPIEPINQDLAQRGFEIYHSEKHSCSKCHGSHNVNGSFIPSTYPEQKFDVKTDSEFMRINRTFKKLYEKTDRIFSQYLNSSYIGPTTGFYPTEDGYIAPPLVGIWASAPYLHNGSVPTLYDLFNPKDRPAIWMASQDPFSYDHDKMGVKYSRIKSSEYEELKRTFVSSNLATKFLFLDRTEKFRTIFNANEFGRSNKGHDYGLDNEDAEALIEYLKSF